MFCIFNHSFLVSIEKPRSTNLLFMLYCFFLFFKYLFKAVSTNSEFVSGVTIDSKEANMLLAV